MKMVVDEIRNELKSKADIKYKEFYSKLMPSVSKDKVIGIKIPVLRKFANQVIKEYTKEDIEIFMNDLPHYYYEENNLHAFLIEKNNDFYNCITELDKFLPFVDNWATTDSISPKCFKRCDDNTRKSLLNNCYRWIKSENTYIIRFGICQLMKFFLDDYFSPEIINIVADIKSEEYYVNMMRAWYFATALVKQYDVTIPFIENFKLDVWTHNKTIQKAIESKRISDLIKKKLKYLKIPNKLAFL